jgi:hypothetical protein
VIAAYRLTATRSIVAPPATNFSTAIVSLWERTVPKSGLLFPNLVTLAPGCRAFFPVCEAVRQRVARRRPGALRSDQGSPKSRQGRQAAQIEVGGGLQWSNGNPSKLHRGTVRPFCSGFPHHCPNRLSGTGIGVSFAGLLRTAIWRGAMNISHRTGRLSRRRAVPRSCLPLLLGGFDHYSRHRSGWIAQRDQNGRRGPQRD